MAKIQEFDDTELLFCTKCGHDYDADPNDLGTYICPCGRKNKNIDKALARLAEKYSKEKNDKVGSHDPKK